MRSRNVVVQPFVEINSAAIPEELVESELFGHAKGAFSGAGTAKKGNSRSPMEPRIFLDEIGDMSPRVQAKMLRVLEEQRFEPVGSNTPVKVDVRVISATNKTARRFGRERRFSARLVLSAQCDPFSDPAPSRTARRTSLCSSIISIENTRRIMAKRLNHLRILLLKN